MSFTKVLAVLGLATQVGNLVLGLLTAFVETAGVSAETKAKALLVHASIAGIVGIAQAFVRSVRDDNNNGIPDALEQAPAVPPASRP